MKTGKELEDIRRNTEPADQRKITTRVAVAVAVMVVALVVAVLVLIQGPESGPAAPGTPASAPVTTLYVGAPAD